MDQVIRAFPEAQARALAGLSKRQLQYWDERDFIRPGLAARQGRGRPRLYSFRDLVSLRVAADLLRGGISLQKIRKVVEHLRTLDYDQPLTELKFWVCNGDLYFEEAATVRAGRRPEQIVASYAVPMAAIVDRLESDIAALDLRTPGQAERRPATLGHQPVFAGTRIPLAAVRRLLRAGASEAEILQLYPDLASADVELVRAEQLRTSRLAG